MDEENEDTKERKMEKKEEEKGIFGIGLAGQEEKRRKSEREGGGRT